MSGSVSSDSLEGNSHSEIDFKGYEYDPSVDMSGYIPLEDRMPKVEIIRLDRSRQVRLVPLVPRKRSSFVGLNGSRRRGRIYHRTISGLKRNRFQGRSMRFLTLTTPAGYDIKRLGRDFNAFCKRLEHVHVEIDGFRAFKPEYSLVATDEGNGVIHCIFFGAVVSHRRRQYSINFDWRRVRKGRGGFPVDPQKDRGYIPFAWLKRTWAEIVGGNPFNQHVYIEKVYGSVSRIASYLCQYVSGQNEVRHHSCTDHWVYRGFVGDWNNFFKPRIADLFRIGEPDLEALDAVYREWDNRICSEFLCS